MINIGSSKPNRIDKLGLELVNGKKAVRVHQSEVNPEVHEIE